MDVEGAVLDVTDRAGCEALVREVEPWGLVNNAGYMNVGRVVDADPDQALRQFDAMRRRDSGRIVNVSSSIAYGPRS